MVDDRDKLDVDERVVLFRFAVLESVDLGADSDEPADIVV
jgi:hypothetical protein